MVNDRGDKDARATGGVGYALLVAAAPSGRQRLMDAAGALHQLAAVPPAALLGTAGGASVVQLLDPADPQTVLTHLRTAAAHEGPVLIYLAGQLTFDAKQRLPHFALARTTPRTARYTALPWHWLAAELARRPAGSSTVLVDLVADETAWPRLSSDPALAGRLLTAGLTLYGSLVPAPPKRLTAAPLYSRAFAAALRGAVEDASFALLHERAVAEAGLGGGPELLFDGSAVHAYAPAAPPAGLPDQPRAAGVNGIVTRVADGLTQPEAEAEGDAPAPRPQDRLPDGLVPEPFAALPPPPPPPPPLAEWEQTPPPVPDPHAAIFEAAHAGRHSEAASMAAAWEQEALRAAGPHSGEAIHWLEVRADLARLADDPARACELWMSVADARLGNGQAADDPDVEGAVDRAHHQWQYVQDPARAGSLAPFLISLRGRVPGRRPGALEAVRRRAEFLQETSQTG
ncbi:hypothetical protein SBI_05910 [Streptomyces bingchenggensis BCW-1]|uniref:Uncharacterized protein n=1 Tax=Streptomyces bingchenggensis (strain BCW-1) TaxID=749414 RepID=D7CGC6_STRBB|nr:MULTISPECIES: hypothetical protein [Streptomyces]ADI09030.1 hypothetical protein SBI_05910 [Streptomyces bingchenggensis BCW-1]